MPTPDPTWYLDVPDPSDLMEGDPPAPGDRWCSLWGPRGPCRPSIEGTADEWLAIADAIEQRKRRAFARVAFAPGPDADHGRLWSPRNAASDATDAILTSYELAELAADIRAKLAPAPPTAGIDQFMADRGHPYMTPAERLAAEMEWRDAIVLAPAPVASPPPGADGAACLRCAIELGEAYSLRARDEPCARHAATAPGSRPPGVPTTDLGAPLHPMAEHGSGPTAGAAAIVDQPPPAPSAGPEIWPLVVADMRERDRIGRERYGTPLRAGNGRDPLVDAYQEALDMAVYLRQAIAERPDRPSCGCNPDMADLDAVAASLGVEATREAILRAIERVRGNIERKDREWAEMREKSTVAESRLSELAARGTTIDAAAVLSDDDEDGDDQDDACPEYDEDEDRCPDCREPAIVGHAADCGVAAGMLADMVVVDAHAAAIDRVLADPATHALALDDPADRDRLREILVAAVVAEGGR